MYSRTALHSPVFISIGQSRLKTYIPANTKSILAKKELPNPVMVIYLNDDSIYCKGKKFYTQALDSIAESLSNDGFGRFVT